MATDLKEEARQYFKGLEYPTTDEIADFASQQLAAVLDALRHHKVRYSRDHGMPNPTPAFPFEVVFTMRDWEPLKIMLEQFSKPEVRP